MDNTILLVDDDPNVLQGLKRAFHREPYDVLTATSADEAMVLLQKRTVDVVVSDEQMPGLSGTNFLRKVRNLYPDTIRFILTGKATLDVAIQAINEGGISRFFVKPCNLIDLKVSIRQELQRRDLAIAARQLLKKVKTQSAQIQRLETEFPSITRVERDVDGAIVVEESPGDLDELMREICEQLEIGEIRLHQTGRPVA